jgi:hypothetical protein
MNNYISLGDLSSQLFFKYKQEKNAIYVVPHISANYGYILPISNRSLTGNTYTFIYQRKPNCELFIAPISHRKHFSKTFVSYKKYSKKLQKYLDKRRTAKISGFQKGAVGYQENSVERSSKEFKSYTNMIEIPKQHIEIKKSYSYQDLGGLNKIMDIFDISPSDKPNYAKNWPLCANDFKPPEPLDVFVRDVVSPENCGLTTSYGLRKSLGYFFGSSPDDFVEDFVFDD